MEAGRSLPTKVTVGFPKASQVLAQDLIQDLTQDDDDDARPRMSGR